MKVSWRANTEGFGTTRLQRVRKEGVWTEAENLTRVGNTLAFKLPESALEDSFCEGSRCDPVEINVDYVTRRPSPVGGKPIEDVRTETAKINLVTTYRPMEDPLVLAARKEPATIVSSCDATYRIGTVELAARHSKAFGTDAVSVSVDLQFAAGEGLWGTSNLLTNLPALPETKPPEYRASLSVAGLTRSGSSWRWRVKAAEGDRSSEWCHFTVAGLPDSAAMAGQGAEPSRSAKVAQVAPHAKAQSVQTLKAPVPVPLKGAEADNNKLAGEIQQQMSDVNRAEQTRKAAERKIASIMATGRRMEPDTNRFGSDYRGFPAGDWNACQAACAGEGQCRA
jgi:hypothetical protein